MDNKTASNCESDFKLKNVDLHSGLTSLLNYLSDCDADMVVAGMVGNVGLMPVFTSSCGLVALANKETLVSAGHLIKTISENPGAEIIPVDSEHSAIFNVYNQKF